jgi:hypothetical protein
VGGSLTAPELTGVVAPPPPPPPIGGWVCVGVCGALLCLVGVGLDVIDNGFGNERCCTAAGGVIGGAVVVLFMRLFVLPILLLFLLFGVVGGGPAGIGVGAVGFEEVKLFEIEVVVVVLLLLPIGEVGFGIEEVGNVLLIEGAPLPLSEVVCSAIRGGKVGSCLKLDVVIVVADLSPLGGSVPYDVALCRPLPLCVPLFPTDCDLGFGFCAAAPPALPPRAPPLCVGGKFGSGLDVLSVKTCTSSDLELDREVIWIVCDGT